MRPSSAAARDLAPRRPARWPACLLVLGLLPGIAAAAGTPLPARVRLECELLVMGLSGTRLLEARQVVLEPGMSGPLAFAVPGRLSGRNGRVEVDLVLSTGPAGDGRLAVQVDGEVTEEDVDGPRAWRIERGLEMLMGTSALVEVAPPDGDGQRLALSVTAVPAAADEALDAQRQRVELDVEVAVVEGDEARVLEHPLLRSLSGQTASFGVDYQVPAADGRSFEDVHLDLQLTPGFLRGRRLPVEVAISGGFPGEDGVVLSSRSDSRLLTPGEIWEMAIRPAAEDGAWLRVRLMARWRPAGPDRGGKDGA